MTDNKYIERYTNYIYITFIYYILLLNNYVYKLNLYILNINIMVNSSEYNIEKYRRKQKACQGRKTA